MDQIAPGIEHYVRGNVFHVHVAVDMFVKSWLPQSISRVVNVKVVHHDGRRKRMKRPMRIPYPHVPHDERMTGVGSNASASAFKIDVEPADIESVIALAVGFVVLKANKRKCANIHFMA